MPYDPILAGEIEVGDPITNDLMTKIKDNQDYFNGLIGGLDYYDIYNGSLDIDADADDTPDGWTVNDLSGGSHVLANANTRGHGHFTFQATDPGGASNGGAELISPYIAATDLRQYFFGFVLDTNATGMGIKVDVERYLYDKSTAGSDINLYTNSTDNPTTPRHVWLGWGPGAAVGNVRFIRLKFTLGDTAVNQAGTAEVSGISMATSMPQVFSATAFTFAERTTTATSWTNLGSAISIDLPYDWYFGGGIPLMISFPVEMRWTVGPATGEIAEFRFTANSGSDISNVLYCPADAVGNGTTAFLSGTVFLQTSPTGESFTVQPQGQISSGAGTIGLTKGAGETSLALMTPGS